MYSQVACLLVAVIAQAPRVAPQADLGLYAELELARKDPFYGDPVFARVTVMNTRNKTVPLPANIFGTVSSSKFGEVL